MRARELFERHPGNPILTAADWPYPANAVFNLKAGLRQMHRIIFGVIAAMLLQAGFIGSALAQGAQPAGQGGGPTSDLLRYAESRRGRSPARS